MRLTHEFLNRGRNVNAVFPCSNLHDYLEGLRGQYSDIPDSYLSEELYIQGAFGLFVEAYMKFFGKLYGIFDIEYLPTVSNIDFAGVDNFSEPSTILSLYVKTDREITMNADHLSDFTNTSRLNYGVNIQDHSNMFVVSNGKKVNETILENAPVLKDKVRFILMEEIEHNTKDNKDFWMAFLEAICSKENIYHPQEYKLRDFQNEAVETLLKNSLGQILLPTGTGKSVIQADYCKQHIEKVNKMPVILIVSPRIVLSYQLLNVVFNHLTFHGIDAQYINLSSGDMKEVSQKMYAQMKLKGLVPRQIEATTDINKIKEYVDRAYNTNAPVIISATYHSAWLTNDLKIPIDVVLCDEAHNLIMGRFSEDFKEDNLKIISAKKFFFTATPCNTVSKDGHGMNNEALFGKVIYRKSYREMIERNEILPVKIHTIQVNDYEILKNQQKGAVADNLKEADFDRDCTVKARAIQECFKFHEDELKKNSAHPESIAPKILVTVDSVGALKGVLDSKEISDMIVGGIKVFAISTEIKYWNNGTVYDSYDFKEQFMKDIKGLVDEDKAIVLHIDMIGEGLDVSGITGVMTFSICGTLKLIQLLGRAMRLHDMDRKSLYAGRFFKGMNRETIMVKPNAYMIVPMFLRESNDLRELVKHYMKEIHANYDFLPSMVYSESKPIGDNENMTNGGFKGPHEIYNKLNFKQDIENDAFNALNSVGSYVPSVSL